MDWIKYVLVRDEEVIKDLDLNLKNYGLVITKTGANVENLPTAFRAIHDNHLLGMRDGIIMYESKFKVSVRRSSTMA